MPASHGSKAVLMIGNVGTPASPTNNLSQYGNSVGATFNRDTAEVTTFAKTSKAYIPGLKDATVPFEGPFDPLADALLWPIFDAGTIVNFVYQPAGPGTGNIQYAGTFFVTSYEVSSDVGDANAVSGEFQVTGDVTRTVL